MCTNIFGKIFCALHVFLCALVLRPVCARTRAQLRGNIAPETLSCSHPLQMESDFGCLFHEGAALLHQVSSFSSYNRSSPSRQTKGQFGLSQILYIHLKHNWLPAVHHPAYLIA